MIRARSCPDLCCNTSGGAGAVGQTDLFPMVRHWGETHDYGFPAGVTSFVLSDSEYRRRIQAFYDAIQAIESTFADMVKSHLEKQFSDQALPTDFALYQNYPNPFSSSTSISFRIPKPGHVQLNIVNSVGQRVRVPVER
jgi:hypothetical protein